jgi:serine/threonine protein kinase
VTKYYPGGNLTKILRSSHEISEKLALKYFVMILLGVQFLHSKDILHRDLKPENIVIDELSKDQKILKIIDFGIAKDQNIISTTQTTSASRTSPAY